MALILSIVKKSFIKNSLSNCIIFNTKRFLTTNNNKISNKSKKLLVSNLKCVNVQIRSACKQFPELHGHQEWVFEKLTTILLAIIIPAAIIHPTPILDYTLAGFLVYHHHVGIHSILIDYARPIVLGKHLAKLCFYTHNTCTALIALGLILFIYNDIGIGNGIRRFWLINNDNKSIQSEQ